ncbi:hypothetical protein [Streptococcus sp. zg-JUN1979]|uniref:hypothetical protein n=1 Tax=Streptococcus sp. zg-JUN1979 TaxID=3391450 RepID=UPI0039A5030C
MSIMDYYMIILYVIIVFIIRRMASNALSRGNITFFLIWAVLGLVLACLPLLFI